MATDVERGDPSGKDRKAEGFDLPTSFNKEIFVVLPLLGSALAIIFDIGYFTAIGSNLFTLFSLNEHIVFALQALPLSIVAAGVITLQYSEQFVERLRTRAEQRPVFKWTYRAASFLALIALAAFWTVIADLYVNIATMVLFVLLFLYYYLGSFIARAVCITSSVTIVVFTMGYALARQDVPRPYKISLLAAFPSYAPSTLRTKAGETIRVRILRTGDRGILFYDLLKKEIALSRWDAFEEIRVPQ